MGGNLYILSLEDGAVREVAPQLTGGLFDRYDLSFDGRRIIFGYCCAIDDGLRLWEIRVDGTDLRQVTLPPPGETTEARAALSPSWWAPGSKTARDGQGNFSSRRFMTQDFHPCYLPDGRIAFTSIRAKQNELCPTVLNKDTHIWVAVLHGVVPVQADGSALFTVPADRNIFLQALDENYMEVQTMRTFVNLRPGERRSCVGCHEDRRQSPSTASAISSTGASRISGQSPRWSRPAASVRENRPEAAHQAIPFSRRPRNHPLAGLPTTLPTLP